MARTFRSVGLRLVKEVNSLINDLAEKIKANASWSSTIPRTVKVIPAKYSGDTRTVTAYLRVGDENTPHARAFEYGTGLHNKKNKREYKIAPKEDNPTQTLAFPVGRWPNYQPPPNIDRGFVFPGPVSSKNYVMHPGVRARPFVRPAVKEMKQASRLSPFAKTFVRGLRDDLMIKTTVKVDINL